MEEKFNKSVEINLGDEQAIIQTINDEYKIISIFNIDSKIVIQMPGFMMMMRCGIIFFPVNLN